MIAERFGATSSTDATVVYRDVAVPSVWQQSSVRRIFPLRRIEKVVWRGEERGYHQMIIENSLDKEKCEAGLRRYAVALIEPPRNRRTMYRTGRPKSGRLLSGSTLDESLMTRAQDDRIMS